jgi:hypothetical protein
MNFKTPDKQVLSLDKINRILQDIFIVRYEVFY